MRNEIKFQKVKKLISKYNKLINKFNRKGEFNKSLALIAASASLQYEFNQWYRDESLEVSLKHIVGQLDVRPQCYICSPNVVLFYDDFGEDIRGLAIIYLEALCKLGYKVIYITKDSVRNLQPEMHKRLGHYKNLLFEYYISKSDYISQIKSLNSIVIKYRPQFVFLYSSPNDVVANCVACMYKGSITSFKINLTDHAFWIGCDCFNYCLEFRGYGAFISEKYRKISSDRIINCPYYPYINKELKYQSFPFERDDKKVIFSGGSLYKTYGEGNLFYKMISNILSRVEKSVFLYAGRGDETEMNKLKRAFPNRVYLIPEQKALYDLMCKVDLYINTYPILGGLMTQYAILSNLLPLTLKHNNDGDGLLLNQEKAFIEYNTANELVSDAIKLLYEPSYMEERKKFLKNQVLDEMSFAENLNSIMINKKSKYSMNLKEISTQKFLEEYLNKFNFYKTASLCLACRANCNILYLFPLLAIGGIALKGLQKLKNKLRLGCI